MLVGLVYLFKSRLSHLIFCLYFIFLKVDYLKTGERNIYDLFIYVFLLNTLKSVTFVYFISGAGKTSLINVLTFRNIRSLVVSGDIKINDRVVNRDQMNDVSAYLQQEDLFLGTMTVREHLLFKVQCSFSAKNQYHHYE